MLGGEQSGFIADIGFETYSRILKDMYHKNSTIKKYLDMRNIENDILLNKGNALIMNKNNNHKYKEVDFLKIGCIKNVIQ